MPSADLLFLRPDIQVEPLVDQWYAWNQLIPPATAARNLVERHLAIMNSYLDAPEVHAAAVKSPRMLGGPFIDYGGGRVDEIRALRDTTIDRRRGLIALSAALQQLDAMLKKSAAGYSLHPLYADVPDPLKGCVELVYDADGRASFRLIEPLFYRSPWFDCGGHSLWLSVTTGDDRPFVLSTPRLPGPDLLPIETPFADSNIDALFACKRSPRPWSEIAAWFDLDDDERTLFRSYFTAQAPPPYEPYTGSGVRWRYFGHACILVEFKGRSVLFDPVLSYTYESDISRYTYLDLPDVIDYVVITHNHIDHLLFETVLQIRHKVRNVVVPRNQAGLLHDPSMVLMLKACGFANVIEMGQLDVIDDNGLSLTGLPFLGEHGDLDVGSKLAYALRVGQETLVFAADSCNVEPRLYTHLHGLFGDVRALFLGMECNGAPMSWLYGPLMLNKPPRAIDESRRLNGSNFEQALAMVDALRCRNVFVYAMGQEPWLNYVMSIKYTEASRPIVDSNRLIATCTARGINAERLFGERELVF